MAFDPSLLPFDEYRPMEPASVHRSVAPPWHSDDIAALAAAEDRLRAEKEAAGNDVMIADELGDDAAYDRAYLEFDRLDRELALLGRRREELEEESAWAAIKEQRRAYWERVL